MPASMFRAVAIVFGLAIATILVPPGKTVFARQTAIVELPEGSHVGGPFSLVTHTGKTVTDRAFRGKYLLIYFGYTYCPDVCPTSLLLMTEALEKLGRGGDVVQPLFITIDPKMDTPDVLATYVEAFHPRLIGLTGTARQIARVAGAYHVHYAAVKSQSEDDAHTMFHTSFTYLMGPDGNFLAMFPHGTDSQDMAATIRQFIAKQSKL